MVSCGPIPESRHTAWCQCGVGRHENRSEKCAVRRSGQRLRHKPQLGLELASPDGETADIAGPKS